MFFPYNVSVWMRVIPFLPDGAPGLPQHGQSRNRGYFFRGGWRYCTVFMAINHASSQALLAQMIDQFYEQKPGEEELCDTKTTQWRLLKLSSSLTFPTVVK